MNMIIKASGLLLLLSGALQADGRVMESNSWTEHFPVTAADPTLEIDNIWGDVRVRPGQTGEIVVTIHEQRSAPDRERFERSLETLRLNTEADSGGVVLFVGNRDRHWGGRDNCRGCEVEYRFEVLVPVMTQLDVSTVNDGDIDIDGVSGVISASNVNGPIAVSAMQNCEVLNSVNGEVRLEFARSPGGNCQIETVNGDITMKLPEDSGLDVTMDLFNGRMHSQLAVNALAMPARVEQIESDGRHIYRIEQNAGVRIGAGGPLFTISSINGDIRIQKIN